MIRSLSVGEFDPGPDVENTILPGVWFAETVCSTSDLICAVLEFESVPSAAYQFIVPIVSPLTTVVLLKTPDPLDFPKSRVGAF